MRARFVLAEFLVAVALAGTARGADLLIVLNKSNDLSTLTVAHRLTAGKEPDGLSGVSSK